MTNASITENHIDFALDLAQRYKIFPCKPSKAPYTQNGYKDASRDPAHLCTWWDRWPDALVGIACKPSGIFALDVDIKDGVNGLDALAELVSTYGAGENIQVGPVQSTPSGGLHLIFRDPENVTIPNNAGKLAPGLDLRSTGYICTGQGYTWHDEHGWDAPITDAPAWLLDLIAKIGQKPAAPVYTPTVAPNNGKVKGPEYWLNKYASRARPGTRNEMGFYLALQLRNDGISTGEAESWMVRYAAIVPGDGYSEKEALASLRSAYKGQRQEPAGQGYYAPAPAAPAGDLRAAPDTEAPAIKTQQGTTTDDANAMRLARYCSGRALYVGAWGWMIYDGKRWARDESGVMLQWARNTARGIYDEAAEAAKAGADDAASRLAKWASISLNYSRITAMIALAQSDLPARTADFDADPYLMAVNNGVLNLRTGQLMPHDAKYRITRLAPVDYDPAAKCTTWLAFLARIFNNDADTIDYLRRAVGYSLTGDVGEQCLFFLYGIGANGKSTFTGAVQTLMGDYSMKSRAETLMVRRNDAIPEEIAQLAGVRFMLAAELGEGQRLNESLVKDITGGDAIRGRLLYRTSFEYRPAAKPWLYGNHKPIIHGTDLGIWRRVKLVPFTVTIPEKERDPHLPEKLQAELSGILNWALSGCMDWQRSGLKAPASVQTATEEYRQSQDILAAFLAECTITSPMATCTAGELYTAYKKWAEESGVNALSKIAVSRQLAERGIITAGRQPGSGRAYYSGLGLLSD